MSTNSHRGFLERTLIRLLHAHQDGYRKDLQRDTKEKQKVTSVGEDMEESGTVVHCWWECRMLQPYKEDRTGIPKNITTQTWNYPGIHRFRFWVHTPQIESRYLYSI